ncbi:carbohydrate ABC transporter permease [Nonomuraea sp. NPDC050153]|uniref:carbohydrate ABC transporter permease n=1 Tax=Nonomuraea sp. NPDC050153 TaxID=3364359 RepID=UPI0037B89B05
MSRAAVSRPADASSPEGTASAPVDPGPGRTAGRRPDRTGGVLGYVFVSPMMFYLLLIMAVPLLWAVWVSLTDKRVGAPGEFVGLANYGDLLTDGLFWRTTWNTLVFTLGAVVLKVVFGLAMALVLNEKFRGRALFRVLLFLPWTVPTIVSVFAWQWMFSDVGGAFNAILRMVGLADAPVPWLTDPHLAMVSVILVNVWRGTPFIGIAILAGLAAVSQEQYEAARVDGATAFQRFFHITLPSVRNVMMLASVITTIWTLNDFEIIWLLTRGGPADATQVFSTLSYTLGFQNLDIAKATTISILSIPLLVILINYVTKRTLKDQD